MVVGERGLGLPEQFVDGVVADLLVEELGAEEVLPLPLPLHLPFDPGLDEQHLGDLVEGGRRVEVLAVADDVVARVEEVGELVLLEGLEPLEQFLDVGVGSVGVGDVLDLFEVARHLVLADAPVLRLAAVVGDDEAGIDDAGVGVALAVVLGLDGDVVGLALDDDERCGSVAAVLRGAPDHEIGAGVGRAAPGEVEFLLDLVEREAVLVDEDGEVRLADLLFGGLEQPLVTSVGPDRALGFIADDLDRAIRGGCVGTPAWGFRRLLRGPLGRLLGHLLRHRASCCQAGAQTRSSSYQTIPQTRVVICGTPSVEARRRRGTRWWTIQRWWIRSSG